jgi:hypothetical protein
MLKPSLHVRAVDALGKVDRTRECEVGRADGAGGWNRDLLLAGLGGGSDVLKEAISTH